jgi:hypothetical protein
MIYKVSYVVQGGEFPGGIRNQTKKPEVGETVLIGPKRFEVIEVFEIMPPRGDFQFLHATVKSAEESEKVTS